MKEQPHTLKGEVAGLPQERLPSSPRREVDGLRFDWEPLGLSEPNLIIFSAEVYRESERARVRFGIDLAKLQTPELEELHNILARRHAGLDNRQSLLRSIEWMLILSLGQTEPRLTFDERKREGVANVASRLVPGSRKSPNCRVLVSEAASVIAQKRSRAQNKENAGREQS